MFLINDFLLDISIIFSSTFSLTLLFYLLDRRKNAKKVLGEIKKKKEKENAFKALRKELMQTLALYGKERLFGPIYFGMLILVIGVLLALLLVGHTFLAIILPATMYLLMVQIIREFHIDFNSVVEKNFPILVNHMAKVFSSTSNLGIVLYESSKEIEEPLRSTMLSLSRELMVDVSNKSLYAFLETTNNLWLHSFIFTLINYKETSSKEDVVDNLLAISNLIETRRDLAEKMAEQRKPVVIINYLLLIVGIVILGVNIVYNPAFIQFMFTPLGTVAVFGGISAVFITIIMNIKFTKIR